MLRTLWDASQAQNRISMPLLFQASPPDQDSGPQTSNESSSSSSSSDGSSSDGSSSDTSNSSDSSTSSTTSSNSSSRNGDSSMDSGDEYIQEPPNKKSRKGMRFRKRRILEKYNTQTAKEFKETFKMRKSTVDSLVMELEPHLTSQGLYIFSFPLGVWIILYICHSFRCSKFRFLPYFRIC